MHNADTELTKWPRLVVLGERVTEEQADEILIRTNRWYLSSNDHQFEAAVLSLAGIATDESGRPLWKSLDEFDVRARVLPLEYLRNEQIVSSWIGGPHGWCHWDGTIGTWNYNIGKWPTIEEIERELTVLVQAFPYLDMRMQLVSDEAEGEPVAQWGIAEGCWDRVEIDETLIPDEYSEETEVMRAVLGVGSFGRERGVDLQRLSSALRRVLASE